MARRSPPDLTAEDRRIWARVAGTVTPPRVRKAPRVTPGAAVPDPPPSSPSLSRTPASVTSPPSPGPRDPGPSVRARAALPPYRPPTGRPAAPAAPRAVPEELEPRRQRRLSRERDPIEATIDLHGFSRFEAEDRLRAFLALSQARGLRAVLVVTGQGRRGGGVIRASIQDWLQGHGLRGVVSGFSGAHRRHGGDGAFYVTLKRR